MSLPGTNGPMRSWLRLKVPSVPPAQVVFSPPRQDKPTLPMLVLYRVGGLPDNQQHDNPDFIVECWAANLKLAEDLAREVAAAVLDAQDERPVVVDGVHVESSGVNLVQPGGEVPGAKRYRVDVSMRMRQA